MKFYPSGFSDRENRLLYAYIGEGKWSFFHSFRGADPQRVGKVYHSRPALLADSVRYAAESWGLAAPGADPRLIAAAPALLAACRELIAEFDLASDRDREIPGHGGFPDTGGIILARAAVAKAEGGAL